MSRAKLFALRVYAAVLRALVVAFSDPLVFPMLALFVALVTGAVVERWVWYSGRASMDDYAHGLQYRFWRDKEPGK